MVASCADPYVSRGESPVADEFIPLDSDVRVLYKETMEEQATTVSEVLDASIRSVELIHGKAFTGEVRVHVCDNPECFTDYTGLKGILAAVTGKGLFLAPFVFAQPDFPEWLTHELSHLHLFQQISMIDAALIPQWGTRDSAVMPVQRTLIRSIEALLPHHKD
ncbi:MAG: hypothetical protein AAGG02_10720 [Cyanobacteria bacterium P01_H01_bin.15]